MKSHKWAKEIKAWADGAEIETTDNEGNWLDCTSPQWYEDEFGREWKYRIKSTPKKSQEETNNYKKWQKQVIHFLSGGKVKAVSLGIEGLNGYVKDVAAFDDDRFIFEIVEEPQYLYVYEFDDVEDVGLFKTMQEDNEHNYVGKIPFIPKNNLE